MSLIPSSPIDFEAIACTQEGDEEMQQLTDTSMQLGKVPLPTCNGTIICDTSTGNPHSYIPVQFHCVVFNASHNLSHPDIRTTWHLLTEHCLERH